MVCTQALSTWLIRMHLSAVILVHEVYREPITYLPNRTLSSPLLPGVANAQSVKSSSPS
jgi:hypothetical protein